MAAIATTLLTFLRPGDMILHSRPLYGGTETLIRNMLSAFGITRSDSPTASTRRKIAGRGRRRMAKGRSADPGRDAGQPDERPRRSRLMAEIADEIGSRQGRRPPIAVDNTLLGPMFQQPLRHGADLALYSLTKYAGGHSDLIAGGVIRLAPSWCSKIA